MKPDGVRLDLSGHKMTMKRNTGDTGSCTLKSGLPIGVNTELDSWVGHYYCNTRPETIRFWRHFKTERDGTPSMELLKVDDRMGSSDWHKAFIKSERTEQRMRQIYHEPKP